MRSAPQDSGKALCVLKLSGSSFQYCALKDEFAVLKKFIQCISIDFSEVIQTPLKIKFSYT